MHRASSTGARRASAIIVIGPALQKREVRSLLSQPAPDGRFCGRRILRCVRLAHRTDKKFVDAYIPPRVAGLLPPIGSIGSGEFMSVLGAYLLA